MANFLYVRYAVSVFSCRRFCGFLGILSVADPRGLRIFPYVIVVSWGSGVFIYFALLFRVCMPACV